MDDTSPRHSKSTRPLDLAGDFLAENNEEVGLTRRTRRAQGSGSPVGRNFLPTRADNFPKSSKQLTRKQSRAVTPERVPEDSSKVRLSDVSGENTLSEFLTNYKRVYFDEVCMRRINRNQIAVWVYVHGKWMRDLQDTPKSLPIGDESWCRFFLRKTLDVSRQNYDEARKRLLFRGASGKDFTGVYKNKGLSNLDNPEFALVYREREKTVLEKLAPGLVVGGAAGAALLTKEYLRRRKNDMEKEAANALRSSRFDAGDDAEHELRKMKFPDENGVPLRQYWKLSAQQLNDITDAQLDKYEKLNQQYLEQFEPDADRYSSCIATVRTLRRLGETMGSDLFSNLPEELRSTIIKDIERYYTATRMLEPQNRLDELDKFKPPTSKLNTSGEQVAVLSQ
jgi:hypothetical protein